MTNWYDIFVFCNNYHFWFCQFLNLQYSYINRMFKTKYGYLKIQHYILWTPMTNWCNLLCKLPVLNFVEFVKISMDFFRFYLLFFFIFLSIFRTFKCVIVCSDFDYICPFSKDYRPLRLSDLAFHEDHYSIWIFIINIIESTNLNGKMGLDVFVQSLYHLDVHDKLV